MLKYNITESKGTYRVVYAMSMLTMIFISFALLSTVSMHEHPYFPAMLTVMALICGIIGWAVYIQHAGGFNGLTEKGTVEVELTGVVIDVTFEHKPFQSAGFGSAVASTILVFIAAVYTIYSGAFMHSYAANVYNKRTARGASAVA